MVTRTVVRDEPDRKEVDIAGDDGLVEHVVYVRSDDGTWLTFGRCPKRGDVNACACVRSGKDG